MANEITAADIRRYRDDPWEFIRDLVIPSAVGEARFGDVMADFQRERFEKLVPDLLSVARGEQPKCGQHWWEATKGASKDSDLAVAMLWLLAFAQRPLLVQVGAADSDQAGEMRKAAADTVHANPWLGKRVEVFKREMVCKATGARVEILSADVAGSHGARPDVIVINELHAITKQEFAENMADNADKVPHGLRIMATNAGFEGTWQFRWREAARLNPDEWFFHKWDKPAPWLSERKIAAARKRNSASRFARLWGGVWAKGTGDALDEADIEACIVLDGPSEPEPGMWYLAALDLGIKHDHAALAILGVKPGAGRIKLALVQSWAPAAGGKVDLIEVEREVLAAHERYGLAWCGYDPFQAELMAQRLGKAGVPMVEVPFVGKTLDLMARELMQAFRNRRIAMYPDQQFVADLFRLRITEKSYGYKLDSASDETGHADRAIAFAIVLPVALEASQIEPEDDDDQDQGPTILVA